MCLDIYLTHAVCAGLLAPYCEKPSVYVKYYVCIQAGRVKIEQSHMDFSLAIVQLNRAL